MLKKNSPIKIYLFIYFEIPSNYKFLVKLSFRKKKITNVYRAIKELAFFILNLIKINKSIVLFLLFVYLLYTK